MGDKTPIERFYDYGAETYVRRKAHVVSARLSRRMILETVLNLPLGPGPWQILDAGGGGGLLAAELAVAGHHVCIADISGDMLNQALQHVTASGVKERVELVKADVCDLGTLGERQFDLVLAVGDVLSYCATPEAALREFRRLTRPGAMLLVEVESRFGGIHGWRRGRQLDEIYRTFQAGQAAPPGWPSVTIRLFEPSEFRLLLQKADWRICSQWPGSICWALLGSRALQEFGRTHEGFERLLEMERTLRKIPELQAAGGDLQFLAAR